MLHNAPINRRNRHKNYVNIKYFRSKIADDFRRKSNVRPKKKKCKKFPKNRSKNIESKLGEKTIIFGLPEIRFLSIENLRSEEARKKSEKWNRSI